MKALCTALLFLSTSIASAAQVGDFAKYRGNADGVEFIMEMKLTAYDAQTDTFTKVQETTVAGEISSLVETVSSVDLASLEQLQMVVEYCETEEVGGTLERSSTPAGNFMACKVEQDGALIGIGPVPFGIITMEKDGVTLELIEYKQN